jgi:hypothetical protein
MSKFTIVGLVSCFIGGLIIAFQAIGGLVKTGGDFVWKNSTLLDLVGKTNFSWVDGMPDGTLQHAVQYIITMPLYLLLVCIGILLLILGQVTSKL